MNETAHAAASAGPSPFYVTKKLPSLRQFEARRANAGRIATKIKTMLSEGVIVFDEERDQVLDVIVEESGDVVFKFEKGGYVIMFMNDMTMDNGALDSIAGYNESFDGWTYFNPKDVKSLRV